MRRARASSPVACFIPPPLFSGEARLALRVLGFGGWWCVRRGGRRERQPSRLYGACWLIVGFIGLRRCHFQDRAGHARPSPVGAARRSVAAFLLGERSGSLLAPAWSLAACLLRSVLGLACSWCRRCCIVGEPPRLAILSVCLCAVPVSTQAPSTTCRSPTLEPHPPSTCARLYCWPAQPVQSRWRLARIRVCHAG